MSNKIPTAVEFLSSKGVVTNKSVILTPLVVQYLEEYANLKSKFHVEAALKAAAEKLPEFRAAAYTEIILSAYPLTNIQ